MTPQTLHQPKLPPPPGPPPLPTALDPSDSESLRGGSNARMRQYLPVSDLDTLYVFQWARSLKLTEGLKGVSGFGFVGV